MYIHVLTCTCVWIFIVHVIFFIHVHVGKNKETDEAGILSVTSCTTEARKIAESFSPNRKLVNDLEFRVYCILFYKSI